MRGHAREVALTRVDVGDRLGDVDPVFIEDALDVAEVLGGVGLGVRASASPSGVAGGVAGGAQGGVRRAVGLAVVIEGIC